MFCWCVGTKNSVRTKTGNQRRVSEENRLYRNFGTFLIPNSFTLQKSGEVVGSKLFDDKQELAGEINCTHFAKLPRSIHSKNGLSIEKKGTLPTKDLSRARQ